MTVALYILNIEDFRPLAETAARNTDVTVVLRGPYYEVASELPFRIDRDATGCRNAIWYSAVAGVAHGTIENWDGKELRIVPTAVGE